MSDNKLMKTIMDAATLTGLAAGIGWVSKKVLKEDMTANPSTNVMNYVKFGRRHGWQHCAERLFGETKDSSRLI